MFEYGFSTVIKPKRLTSTLIGVIIRTMTDSQNNISAAPLSFQLQRRGFSLGLTPVNDPTEYQDDPLSNWHQGKPVFLKGLCSPHLTSFKHEIESSDTLYAAILNGQECDTAFTQSPYIDRIEPNFESLGCSVNEGDQQEIETIIFDAIDINDPDKILAEDLWLKASWLSFYEGDASLRFRFSFGVDLVEDVAADRNRQHHAARLTEAIFPESSIITQNEELAQSLKTILNGNDFKFVERIVYFNAPEGGAYLHHDRERGHAGVVYAQLSGQTFWLALAKKTLVNEIIFFIEKCQKSVWPNNINQSIKLEILDSSTSKEKLAIELESFSNSALIHLINETADFVQQLIEHGHSRHLTPGDVILLPQDSELDCCWHSVFCLGDESGEALSFAIRST